MKNYVQEGKTIRITVGSGITAGDPVLVGELPGVAVTDYDAADGKAEVMTEGVFNLTVKGAGGAIVLGEIVYYDGGDINDDSTNGTKFGKALTAVGSGASPTVPVLLVQ